uniref:Transposase IS4-like domain-containing protein n=1 Tax=Thermosporothrix sp. COM3 TaxID=2490863 RepID=A0A455STE9_9CHLR|nr:hypothetical protein KTC_64540 [Thermosporothrix sp. COM3]
MLVALRNPCQKNGARAASEQAKRHKGGKVHIAINTLGHLFKAAGHLLMSRIAIS